MAHNKQHRANPLALSGLLAFAASLLIITTKAQTTSEAAAAPSSESESAEKFLSNDDLNLEDFDLEDVGEHERPDELLRNLRGGRGGGGSRGGYYKGSSSRGGYSKWSGRSSAFITLYTTTRLSANRYGYSTGFDESACDKFWVENPTPTDEQMQSEEYV